jgi:hypothetical protein
MAPAGGRTLRAVHAAIRQLVHLSDMDVFIVEWQLFPEGTIPEYTTPEWYAGRERAPHLEQEPHKWRLETAAGFVTETVIEPAPRWSTWAPGTADSCRSCWTAT